MKLQITGSAASSFAHLLGLGAKRAASAQDPEEENEDDEKNLPAKEDVPEETKPNDEEDESEKPDEDAEAADEDEDAEAEDGDEKDDDKTKKAKASARRKERARCAAIFRSRAAAARPDLAAHLAFNTGLSAARARGLLEAAAGPDAGAARRSLTNAQLAERMAGVTIPNPGTGASAPASVAQRIVAANNRRLGLK